MSSPTPESKRAFLFSLREDGSPTCHPMTATVVDGQVTFNTYGKSAKARNFARNPDAAMVLLNDWEAPPSGAQCLSGALEQFERSMPVETPSLPRAEASLAPAGASARAADRVRTGKRILLRFKER